MMKNTRTRCFSRTYFDPAAPSVPAEYLITPDPNPAIKLLEDVPCDTLPEVLSGILPYHSREEMHRTKAKSIHKKTLPHKFVESGKTKTRMAPDPAALMMSGFSNF